MIEIKMCTSILYIIYMTPYVLLFICTTSEISTIAFILQIENQSRQRLMIKVSLGPHCQLEQSLSSISDACIFCYLAILPSSCKNQALEV